MKFEVGDIVEWCGVPGVAEEVELDRITVLFNCKIPHYRNFLGDGRLHDWHTEPSLKLIERPAKAPEFVEKTMYVCVYLYMDGEMSTGCKLHDTAEKAASISEGYAERKVWVKK
jgi:hypothetical protein